MALSFSPIESPLALAISLTPAVTGWLVPLVVGFLKRSVKRASQERPRGREVRYARSTRFIMLVAWLFILILSFICIPIVYNRPEGWKGILVLGAFLAMSVILRMETSLMRITWDDRFIYTQSAWRSSRVIPITAVRSCGFREKLRFYRVHAEGNGEVLVHESAVGLGVFLQALPCQTPPYPWSEVEQ